MATASTLLGQTTSADRFSSEAATWDSNPFVHTATSAAYTALTQHVPTLSTTADPQSLAVLEVGCGTGILSLQVAAHPAVSRVVAVDAAPGMIRVLETKVAATATATAANVVVPLCVLLESPEDPRLPPARPDGAPGSPRLKFDLVTSHLVLHHVPLPSVRPLLETMYGCLERGGRVALTDFEDFGPEAKRFHPRSRLDSVERHGIPRGWIEALLREVGFTDVKVEVGFTLEKVVERTEGEFGERSWPKEGEGGMMDFPFLVCMGTKP